MMMEKIFYLFKRNIFFYAEVLEDYYKVLKLLCSCVDDTIFGNSLSMFVGLRC